ncbi:MAG: hypothetical protein K2X77_11020 [Candidatus Obscuribacterales bacterium]|nr:hypothetical protein [Candidatus Obscuribacterales bacterium]
MANKKKEPDVASNFHVVATKARIKRGNVRLKNRSAIEEAAYAEIRATLGYHKTKSDDHFSVLGALEIAELLIDIREPGLAAAVLEQTRKVIEEIPGTSIQWQETRYLNEAYCNLGFYEMAVAAENQFLVQLEAHRPQWTAAEEEMFWAWDKSRSFDLVLVEGKVHGIAAGPDLDLTPEEIAWCKSQEICAEAKHEISWAEDRLAKAEKKLHDRLELQKTLDLLLGLKGEQ